MHDLVAITQSIVHDGFPELKKDTIITSYCTTSPDSHTFEVSIGDTIHHIDVDPLLKRKKVKVIEGGIAHELAHIVIAKNQNKLLSIIDDVLYPLPIYSRWLERKTDLLVIDRGFGHQLLEYTKFYNKHYEPYTHWDGLTLEELKEKINPSRH